MHQAEMASPEDITGKLGKLKASGPKLPTAAQAASHARDLQRALADDWFAPLAYSLAILAGVFQLGMIVWVAFAW